MRSIKNITIIGAGNVATHLGKALYNKGLKIDNVYSRKISRARKLATQIGAKAVSNYTNLKPNSDLYLIAVFDDAIASVCLLYTSPSPRDATLSRMPSSA